MIPSDQCLVGYTCTYPFQCIRPLLLICHNTTLLSGSKFSTLLTYLLTFSSQAKVIIIFLQFVIPLFCFINKGEQLMKNTQKRMKSIQCIYALEFLIFFCCHVCVLCMYYRFIHTGTVIRYDTRSASD